MKRYRNKVIAGVAVLAVLAFAFWWGGNAPGLHGWNTQTDTEQTSQMMEPDASATSAVTPSAGPSAAPQENGAPAQEIQQADEPATAENRPGGNGGAPLTAEEKIAMAAQMAGGASSEAEGNGNHSESQEPGQNASSGEEKHQTPAPEERPTPAPQEVAVTDKELTCTLSVRCDSILQNMAWLDAEKAELVPKDGVIFAEQTVTFYEGESVFNLLLREMKKNKIHMEYQNTPVYNSAYIEGIHNLYEYDCGELSGWMYKVNGWFPNYGCSRYILQPGDRVEWVYTCDMGMDVGGYDAAGGWQR